MTKNNKKEKIYKCLRSMKKGRIQNMNRGPWTTPWTNPNFQKDIAPVNMKIYRRSGFEKHRLISIAYVLEGLSRISGLPWDRAPINGKTTNSF